MKFRELGKTGLKVSDIGFGAWALGGDWWGSQDDAESANALHKAIDLGCNFIDTAAVYGDGRSEKVIGKVLKERSEEIYVATKIPLTDGLWPPSPYCKLSERYSEKHLRENIEIRLKCLGVDCIDVLQLHTWTRAWNADCAEVFGALQKLRSEGKVRFIGVSTPEHDQDALNGLMREGLIDTVQVIFNLFEQQPAAELLPLAEKTRTGVIVRMVYDEGVLTGKFGYEHKFGAKDFRSKYFANNRLERSLRRLAKIKKIIDSFNKSSESRAWTLPEVAMKFALNHNAVSTVIPGIRNARQAEHNLSISSLSELPEDLVTELQKNYWYRGFWYFDNPEV